MAVAEVDDSASGGGFQQLLQGAQLKKVRMETKAQ